MDVAKDKNETECQSEEEVPERTSHWKGCSSPGDEQVFSVGEAEPISTGVTLTTDSEVLVVIRLGLRAEGLLNVGVECNGRGSPPNSAAVARRWCKAVIAVNSEAWHVFNVDSIIRNFWWFHSTHSKRCFSVTLLLVSKSTLGPSTCTPMSLNARRVSWMAPSIQAFLAGQRSKMAIFSLRSRKASPTSARTRSS